MHIYSAREFTQLLVVMYLYLTNNLKIAGIFILLNNKKEHSYNIVFRNLYNITTNNETIKNNIITITLDFEVALINAIQRFLKIKE